MRDFEEEGGGDDAGPDEDETDDDGEGDRSIKVGNAGDSSSEDENSTLSEDLYSRRDIVHFIVTVLKLQNFQNSQFPK